MFDIENWLPFLLAKSHQKTFSLMKAAVEKFELTPPQFATLSFLWKGDGINQKELGELMCVDRTTIGGITERLEKLGYIRREDDPDDGRSSILFVTEKGLSLEKEIVAALDQVKKVLNQKLTQQEQLQLVQLLKKLRSCEN